MAQQTRSKKPMLQTGEPEPDLVSLYYDIWPGNEVGLFLQPQSPHGAATATATTTTMTITSATTTPSTTTTDTTTTTTFGFV